MFDLTKSALLLMDFQNYGHTPTATGLSEIRSSLSGSFEVALSQALHALWRPRGALGCAPFTLRTVGAPAISICTKAYRCGQSAKAPMWLLRERGARRSSMRSNRQLASRLSSNVA